MQCDRDSELKKITQLDFALVDLGLYLNTHPEDNYALNLYNDIAKKADMCRMNYEKNFGPLCSFRSCTNKNSWNWINNPWPWSAKFNFNFKKAY